MAQAAALAAQDGARLGSGRGGFHAGSARGARDEAGDAVCRTVLPAALAALPLVPGASRAAPGAFRFGPTPVCLISDLSLLARLQAYLERSLRLPVKLATRRTYQEITALLISGELDAAWICGLPFVAYQPQLALAAALVWRVRPFYQWPGNVRELRNRVQRAAARAAGRCLMPDDFFPDLAPTSARSKRPSSLEEARGDAEGREIRRALTESGGVIAAAAAALGIARTTMREKMKRHGIDLGRVRD